MPEPARLVFFEVQGRRDLSRRAAAARPSASFVARRSWTEDPGAPREGRWSGRERVGLWLWRGTADDLHAMANDVLLGLIHPLVARGLPFCFGFPFAADLFSRRPVAVDEAARLDLEDIGVLLGVTPADRPGPSGTLLARRTGGARCGQLRTPNDGVTLDEAQRAAVEHAAGPARILAPAGAGKTKTLVSRVAELVDRGVEPSRILLLAFNRKAAEQLEERLAVLGIPTTRRLAQPGPRRARAGLPSAPGVHCATFNAFGYRYQRQIAAAHVALDAHGGARRRLMSDALQTAGVCLADLRPLRGSDPVGAFLGALSQVRAGLERPDDVQVRLETASEPALVVVPFAGVHACYARLQCVTGCQSFDDQIYLAVADLLQHPERRAFVQGLFDHVLVDEFQDLNGAQLALVDILSRPHRDLFVVGDDDQLIYGWRAADPRGILEFHQRMPPKPWSATYTLRTNYRCSRAVVECTARLVAHNTVREPKDVRPREGAAEGAVRFFAAPSWPGRAAAMCAFLRDEKARLGCDWRDLAVLVRYRSQQLAVALALDAEDLPRTPCLGYRLFCHPAAQLLRGAIGLVRDPAAASGEELGRLLLQIPRPAPRAVADDVARAPRAWERLNELAAAEPSAGPRPLGALVQEIEDVTTATAERTPGGGPSSGATSGRLVWTVVDALGLEEHWAAVTADAVDPEQDGALRVLDALLRLAETYPQPESYVRVWDRLLAAEEAHEGVDEDSLAREEAQQDRIVIATIHSAKGREYHSVVIPDYDCDVTRWEAAAIEEERRVVYVGVTRARHAALLTVDSSRPYVHPFLRELVEPPGLEERASLSAWLDQEPDEDVRRRIATRLEEIAVLFPELLPEQTTPGGGPTAT